MVKQRRLKFLCEIANVPGFSAVYAFELPVSVSPRFGTGSFYHQAKIVRKTSILFCDFFLTFYL
jgi:hypothetical protein